MTNINVAISEKPQQGKVALSRRQISKTETKFWE